MPLLKNKTLEKAPLPEFLRDDEEVFHCAMTNEIFRNYDEFAERTILCNSMVWKCAMTGKSNLTYLEALQSEENAIKTLRDFPQELLKPVLFLANKTKRSAFGEMAEDVFIYVKDRFFVGEYVEPTFTGSKWKEYQVIQVIAPSEDAQKKSAKNGHTEEKQFFPPASLYKYSLESQNADDEDISEKIVVDYNQIRRRKGAYSKEKNKLLLKQHVEQSSEGLWTIKSESIEKYGLDELKFDQIFDGPLPNFEVSKKIEKKSQQPAAVKGKKVKQETLAKYLTKNNLVEPSVGQKKSGNLLEQMKKKEKEFKQMKEDMKQKKAEEKLAEKQKKREENLVISSMLRDWNKPKEDLELEDQKKIPEPTPVQCKIPDRYFGEVLMVLEFAHSFSKILNTKDFFPGGLTLELMERALVEREVAGPFIDLIQMLLLALFYVQEEEASQYKTTVDKITKADGKDEDDEEEMNLKKASYYATVASKWCNTHQGLPLSKLPLYPLTVSEILRLHLLTSGARIIDIGARWRYQERGGYTNEDDPALHLRLHEPHILKALANHSIVQLPINDKLTIISCLINQLLTYADVRDLIEERIETQKQAKADFKALQAVERKIRQEYITAKVKLKLVQPKDLDAELKKLADDHEMKQQDNEHKMCKLMQTSNDKVTLLGYDRAFRRYLKIESLPGLFVNHEDENVGSCLNDVVAQNPELINAGRKETMQHLRKLNEEMNTSDKENNPEKDSKAVNGVKNPALVVDPKKMEELYMCSSDPQVCMVHSTTREKQRWSFYHDPVHVDELLNSLNKRGIREGELLLNVEGDQVKITKLVQRTPVAQLNPTVPVVEVPVKVNKKKAPPKKVKNRYGDANMGFPSDADPSEVLHSALVDNILELEEKLHAGNLGTLKIKDRNAWRDNLQNCKYDELDKTLVKIENGALPNVEKIKIEGKSESRASTPDSTGDDKEKEKAKLKEYCDPGKYLGPTLDVESGDSGIDEGDSLIAQSDDLKKAICTLAIALAQVTRAIDPKYLKKPLGSADFKGKKQSHEARDILSSWEESLLASTSFSQIFLHYGILDNCIMWSRSALLAKCRICRRQTDSENMLLCDACNLGHHLYCLKPKLSAVPVGDWFCKKCLGEKEAETKQGSSEPAPKKRKIFRDEDVEEEEQSDVEEGSESDESGDEQQENGDGMKVDLCCVCESGGELLYCDKCPKSYHLECVQPPLRRAPRGKWMCAKCAEKEKKKQNSRDSSDSSRDDVCAYGVVAQRTGGVSNQRRCAARARHKIHDFAKSLRGSRSSDDSDSSEEISNHRRSNRRDVDGRDDLPLHNAALQELLSEVMKHKDAWPFIRPVQKTEVPDYYEVISKPMDFGTIKYKLNMGNYKCDADLMADAVLVFENCNTYNDSDAIVYKCGVRLLKHFEKKCKELGLKLPEEMQQDEEDAEPPKTKKRRTK